MVGLDLQPSRRSLWVVFAVESTNEYISLIENLLSLGLSP